MGLNQCLAINSSRKLRRYVLLNGEVAKQYKVTELRREDLKETCNCQEDDFSDNETGFASVIDNVFLPKNGELPCN